MYYSGDDDYANGEFGEDDFILEIISDVMNMHRNGDEQWSLTNEISEDG